MHDMWLFGTMRSCVFATSHTESTRVLTHIFQEAGMGALVGKVAMNRNCPPGLSEAFWLATKSGGSFFGKVGSFEPGYEFDALVINDSDLNHDNYTLLERLERYIYLGDDRHIEHRFCRGKDIPEPKIN
ncbi:MAG: hypothetical protein J6X46_04870 [Prevotella sp.]|nr:hypothetical protein [Prevotella sp.]